MQRIFIYITLLCCLVMTACSPKVAKAPLQPENSTNAINYEPTEKSLLWKISGGNLKSPSYLYGTIHMIGKEDFFLTDSTMLAFKKAERLVMEIDMKEMGDPSAMMGIIGKVMMKDGTTLSDLLTKEEYQKVETYFAEKGMPMMMMERIKPFFLSMMTSEDFDMEQMTNPNAEGNGMTSYEMEFMEMSVEQDMETGGLETLEFQIGIFDSIPYKEQAKMLVESLDAPTEDGASELETLVKLYKTQDIAAMVEAFKGEEGGIGNYINLLLNNRNENWIPVIEKMIRKQPTFFAVGAGHLGGKKGVIALLRRAGYTVTPMTSTTFVKRTKTTKI